MTEYRRLPDAELEVMLALWDATDEAPRAWFDEVLRAHGWSSNTINTYLARLAQKGFVACRKEGKLNYYRPLVKKEEYLAFESRSTINKLYGGALSNFVAALHDGGLPARELEELQSLLDAWKRGERGG